MSAGGARLRQGLVLALASALACVGLAAPASAVPAALNLEVTTPAFAGEEFLAQSDRIDTPNGRTGWSCRVDLGDGSAPGGYWRAHPYDSSAPCAAFHTYAVAGTYTVVMTVTDPDGGTVTEQQDVTVSQRPVSTKAAGVEGTTVTLTGAAGEDGTMWSIAGTSGRDACEFGAQPAQTTTVTCYRDGTYRVVYDSGDSATSGAYDVTWTNGAPRPTVQAQRTKVKADGSPYYVPVRRVGTGDEVRFDVTAHDPSTHGTEGDRLTCKYNHGNGRREVQDAYGPQGSCNGLTAYLAPGRHTSRVRVTDEDGAVGRARASVVVVRRDVHLAVRDVARGGAKGGIRASLTPKGLRGKVALRWGNGRSLVSTRLTLIEVTSFGAVRLSGRATLDGKKGYSFYAFPDTRYPQGIAFSLRVWRTGKPGGRELNENFGNDEFRVRLHAPPVR